MRFLLFCFFVLFTGCSFKSPYHSALSHSGTTEGTHSEVFQIPYDSKLPRAAIVVEPFIFRPSIEQSIQQVEIYNPNHGVELAAKLTTALSNIGNFEVLDSGVKRNEDSTYSALLQNKSKGLYIIRATVTELSENVEAEQQKQNVSLGLLGIVGSIVGTIAGSDIMKYGGIAIAVANPSYKSIKTETKGMVTVDFRIVNAKTGRILHAFKSEGTFSEISRSKEASIFGIGGGEEKKATSVIGQALTVVINDAVIKIHKGICFS